MDRVRIGSFSNFRFTPILDVNDGVTYTFQRDALKITPPQPQQSLASSGRRYGGARVAGETHENGSVETKWFVAGSSMDDATVKAETLLSALANTDPGRYLEIRPDLGTKSVYYELRGPTPGWTPSWRWLTQSQQSQYDIEGSFMTAPLAIGDPLDTIDDFGADYRSEYTFDGGASGDVLPAGGVLTPVVGAALTAERRAVHTTKGYTFIEGESSLKATPGTTISGYKAGLALRRSAANTYIDAYVDDNGTNSRLRIDTVIGGSRVNVATTNLAARVATGTSFWVVPRIQNNVVTLRYFAGPATALVPAAATVTYTLTAANQAALPAGYWGWDWIPQSANATLDDWSLSPYTFEEDAAATFTGDVGLNLCDLRGPIPGTADALADLYITTAVAYTPSWMLVGWAPRGNFNRVWNGDFRDDIDGWAGTGGYIAGTSTLSRNTVDPKFGTGALQVVTPATNTAGAVFNIYGEPFKPGITYTISAWVKSAAQTTRIDIGIGSINNGAESAGPAGPNLTSSWQQISTTWTPTTHRTDMQVFIRIGAATATTFLVDGVAVIEGTVPPAGYPQSEGRGASPPMGIIEPAGADTSLNTGSWTVTADTNATSGKVNRWTPSGAGSASLSFYVDPSLVPPDTFAGNDLRVEVYGGFVLPSAAAGLTATLSVGPDIIGLGATRYTEEWGQAGRLLTLPSSGSARRVSRLGTLNLTSDSVNPQRWKLTLTLATGAGASGNVDFDFLFLVPVRARAAGQTGKPNDTTYPKWSSSYTLNPVTKRITAQLSGSVSDSATPYFPDHGLGGHIIELPVGRSAITLSQIAGTTVPDDPTLDTSTTVRNQVKIHASVTPRYYLARGA